MNSNPDPRLEDRITRELKALGELPAPNGLTQRVLRRVAAQSARPWYHRAWTTWPRGLQVAFVLVLAAGFAGLCWLAGGISQTAADTVAAQKQNPWYAQLGFVWNLLRVCGDALAAIISHVGKGTVIALGLLVATAYAACLGLGTAYVRFALNHARRI